MKLEIKKHIDGVVRGTLLAYYIALEESINKSPSLEEDKDKVKHWVLNIKQKTEKALLK